MRHAGRAAGSRTQVPLRSTGAAHGAAVLTHPDGIRIDDDDRLSSGHRLTPAFGVQLGHRRSAHDVPAFGSPEHSALMSGALDLEEIARAAQGPVIGFTPIVLDPRGPSVDDLADGATSILPTRRSLRSPDTGPSLGRPLSDGVLPGSGLPAPRPGSSASGAAAPPLQMPLSTGALRVKDVEQALAARPARPMTDDPTPTGELARPFVVGGAPDSQWLSLEDVPPPVSVDVFQRAVRAGLAPDDPATLKALDGEAGSARGTPGRSGRSRRELRARERAATSTRSVTARRLAKGGVLAITALGVVSGATPQGLNAFGITNDTTGSPHNTIDFAAALAPETSAPVLSTGQLAELRQASLAGHLEGEQSEVKASDAVHAGMQAGGTVAQLAQQLDAQVLADREAARQRAIRNVIDDPQGYARMAAAERGWGSGQFQCLVSLWNKESHWNYRASNASSGAYGIAQALPGDKMNMVGADWRTNPVTQIKWGLNYIADRYGTPCGAWSHSQATGWY